MRDGSHVNWDAWSDDYALVRDAIAATYPEIFADFNTRIIATRKGFDRPIAARQRKWNTKSGRANFIPPPCLSEDPDLPRRRDGILTLITVRSNDQFNTTVYGYEDRLRGIYGTREVVLMHEADMRSLGIADGEIVDIIGDAGDGVERQVLGFRATRMTFRMGVAPAIVPNAIHCFRSGTTPLAATCPPQNRSQCGCASTKLPLRSYHAPRHSAASQLVRLVALANYSQLDYIKHQGASPKEGIPMLGSSSFALLSTRLRGVPDPRYQLLFPIQSGARFPHEGEAEC